MNLSPILIVMVSLSASASVTKVFVAQTAQGSADGTSCANARAASWFNSGGNWGSGATQIGPGSTVGLCGTISTDLTFQGDGTSTQIITVDGSGGALMSGSFQLQNRSWFRVQNVTWVDNVTTNLIVINGGSNGVFTGCHADGVSGDPAVWLGQYNGAVLPSNMTISNNFIRTTASNLGNTQLDMIKTEGSTNIVIEGNYLEMRAGGAGNEAHDDILQTYEKGGTSAGHPSNWTVRYNKIVMNSAADADRSWCMWEAMSGINEIYDNVFVGLSGAGSANGVNISGSAASTATYNIFNNSFVSTGSASNNMMSLQGSGTFNLRNNLIWATWQTMLYTVSGTTIHRDHNTWFGSNTPSCSGVTGEVCGVDPKLANVAGGNFSLSATSPALGAGANLGAAYNQSLTAASTWPNPSRATRSATGAWSMSAYDVGGATVAPPTNLRIVR